jgi:regulator of protease activity HflC (stomatin/prohibitin superfamily)
MREKKAFSLPGGAMLLVIVVMMALTIFLLVNVTKGQSGPLPVFCILAMVLEAICLRGLVVVNPNEGQVIQLFGRYVGTVREQGFQWINPLTTRRKISLRVRNFETDKLKVNDLDGNPIEIAAVVVWQVVDSAEAVFEVDNYENFVQVQSESALRNMATSYAYDSREAGKMSLAATRRKPLRN